MTTATTVLERVRAHVVADFAAADPAHDIGHLDRVAFLAADIAVALGADPLPAQVAAYVHDYHRVEEAKQGRRPIRPEEASAVVSYVLAQCAVPDEWHAVILRSVELTGQYRFAGEELDSECLVAAIVHDADNLDAIGAIGIGRAFAFGGVLGEPLWNPHASLKGTYEEGHTSSVLAHLYEKLVHLENDMLTGPARAMAADRTLLLHRFAANFRLEWDGGKMPLHPSFNWDPLTRFLQVRVPQGDRCEPSIRIAFRGRVWLTFDVRDRLVAIDLLEVPDALACSVSPATRHRFPGKNAESDEPMNWLLDAESAWVWLNIANGVAHHRLVGIGDIEVGLHKGKLHTFHLHLRDETMEMLGVGTSSMET